jgi:cell division protein FtsB
MNTAPQHHEHTNKHSNNKILEIIMTSAMALLLLLLYIKILFF